MKKHQLNELVKWLKGQIEFANHLIEEAHNSKNYGKETQYAGMRDAYLKCLNQLPG